MIIVFILGFVVLCCLALQQFKHWDERNDYFDAAEHRTICECCAMYEADKKELP